MAGKRLRVTQESNTGRNERFHDTQTGHMMSRAEVVRRIKTGIYDNYHVRTINGVATPVSNPDASANNNLG